MFSFLLSTLLHWSFMLFFMAVTLFSCIRFFFVILHICLPHLYNFGTSPFFFVWEKKKNPIIQFTTDETQEGSKLKQDFSLDDHKLKIWWVGDVPVCTLRPRYWKTSYRKLQRKYKQAQTGLLKNTTHTANSVQNMNKTLNNICLKCLLERLQEMGLTSNCGDFEISSTKLFCEPFLIVWSEDVSDHQSTKQTRSIGYCSCYPVEHLFLWLWHFLGLFWYRIWDMASSTDIFEAVESRVSQEWRTFLPLKLCATWYLTSEKVMRDQRSSCMTERRDHQDLVGFDQTACYTRGLTSQDLSNLPRIVG